MRAVSFTCFQGLQLNLLHAIGFSELRLGSASRERRFNIFGLSEMSRDCWSVHSTSFILIVVRCVNVRKERSILSLYLFLFISYRGSIQILKSLVSLKAVIFTALHASFFKTHWKHSSNLKRYFFWRNWVLHLLVRFSLYTTILLLIAHQTASLAVILKNINSRVGFLLLCFQRLSKPYWSTQRLLMAQ